MKTVGKSENLKVARHLYENFQKLKGNRNNDE